MVMVMVMTMAMTMAMTIHRTLTPQNNFSPHPAAQVKPALHIFCARLADGVGEHR